MKFAKYFKSFIINLSLGAIATLIPVAVTAAERIVLNIPPFGQFYIQIEDLETFVATGEISDELAYYLDRLPPQQVEKLPELLSTTLEANPLSIYKFSNSTVGEATIKNFGKGIRSDINLNGFHALRGAIIAAAFDSEGLTVINLLHQFPLNDIYIDLPVLNKYFKRGATLLKNRDVIDDHFFAQDKIDGSMVTDTAQPNQLADLQISGAYQWDKSTFAYKNPRRQKEGHFDLYIPKARKKALFPLVVISHGLASDRQTFAYLAEHFASHGLAVAVIEHDGISLNKFDNFLSGSEKFPEPNNLIDQPWDVKTVLDRLEQEAETNPRLQNKINFAQIGILGQSFGGYTSLALAGGELIADPLATECQSESYRDVLLDFSSLAKCTLNDLEERQYRLRDPRIKATVAINPLSKIFGPAGMSSIEIPTMLISGTHDLFMPPLAEQIEPFSWLSPNLDKYLVLAKPGTHFSFLPEGLGVLPVPNSVIGHSPTSAHPGLKALSTAFFKVHLAEQIEYRDYLKSDRASSLNNSEFKFTLLRFLTQTKLQELMNH